MLFIGNYRYNLCYCLCLCVGILQLAAILLSFFKEVVTSTALSAISMPYGVQYRNVPWRDMPGLSLFDNQSQ